MKRIVLIFMILMASVSVLGGCVKNVPSIDHSGEIVIPEPKEEDKKVIGAFQFRCRFYYCFICHIFSGKKGQTYRRSFSLSTESLIPVYCILQ